MKLKTARQVPLAILLFTMLFGLSVSAGRCESPPPVFSTWYIFEVDKLASIWLVKRFVHPEAEIRLYSKGEPILKGIPFDTPDAHFRRYHNASTYEMFRRHYKIEDPRCIYISRIVHDIEINTWGKKAMKESRPLIDSVAQIIAESSNSDEIIDKSIRLFDELYVNASILP